MNTFAAVGRTGHPERSHVRLKHFTAVTPQTGFIRTKNSQSPFESGAVRNVTAAPTAVAFDQTADQSLVSRAQAGEQLAFDLLVRKYQSRIIQLAQRIVGEADAQDVAQEAFIKAYRSLGSLRGDCAFYPWHFRVRVNTAKHQLLSRTRRRSNQEIDVDDVEKHRHQGRLSDVGTPEANLLAEEINATIAMGMQRLPDDLRTAITLREIKGLRYEEIAAVMDCPLGTVRSRIFRAREAIDVAIVPLLDRS
jgi:RNA polymerase sigma-70 factor (ECF subfamily)